MAERQNRSPEERARQLARQKRRRRQMRRKRARIAGLTALVLIVILAISPALIGGRSAYGRIARWTMRLLGIDTQTYPMEYTDFITTYAAQNGLEPAYVASVILAESSYKPDAVSSVGTRGLMQILEETGQDIARWMGEDFEWDSMFDPETNIRYGCYYLGRLMQRYDQDMPCASSAYHQGPGVVDRWLENPKYSPDGKTLAVIPSDVTRTYISNILRYYEKYQQLYAAQN